MTAAPAARVSVFTEVDPLPLPEREPAVADGDGEVGPQKRCFHMARDVIEAFVEVPEEPCVVWGF